MREPALRECDHGGDLWSAFTIWMTVRVYMERQIVLPDGDLGHLMPWMEALPIRGSYEVEVTAQHDRPAHGWLYVTDPARR